MKRLKLKKKFHKEELAEGVTLYCGDCIEALAALPAASIDSVVCDPPYHLTMARFADSNARAIERGFTKRIGRQSKNPFAGQARGFMGKRWDGGDIAFRPETWAAVLRVMKPGAHLVAFGGTRTYHRMACAIEDAGFEVRDTIAWLYGSGFPKSHDVSKGIDRKAGAVRKVVGRQKATGNARGKGAAGHYANALTGVVGYQVVKDGWDITAPATAAARQWAGFGTALKPAFEPIILARKPLAPGMTVAGNVLAYGTGGINIDGCRVYAPKGEGVWGTSNATIARGRMFNGSPKMGTYRSRAVTGDGGTVGRWPANLVHDGSDEVLKGFPETGPSSGHRSRREPGRAMNPDGAGKRAVIDSGERTGHTDSGSAARFFYCAKASKRDRLGSKHPTVKPIALMQWLVRLVTPPNGTVLDPFAGTGTTGQAALQEGFRAILIEREREYQADIRRRIYRKLDNPEFFVEKPKTDSTKDIRGIMGRQKMNVQYD